MYRKENPCALLVRTGPATMGNRIEITQKTKNNKTTIISSYSTSGSLFFKYMLMFSLCVFTQSFQSYPTLCDPMYGSPAGSSDCGVLQVRILEWVAMPSSRGSSKCRD